MFQVEIRNTSVSDDINKTTLTVNCDNYEANTRDTVNNKTASTKDEVKDLPTKDVVDVNNNNEQDNHEGDKETPAAFHLNIPIQNSEKDDEITQPLTDDSKCDNDDILVHLTKTAKEMREIIMRRKKKDPRKEKRKDLKRRVEMIEEL